jgi:hypothetical protein
VISLQGEFESVGMWTTYIYIYIFVYSVLGNISFQNISGNSNGGALYVETTHFTQITINNSIFEQYMLYFFCNDI